MNSQKRFPSGKILTAALDAGLPYRRILRTIGIFFLGALCSGAVYFGTCRPFALSLTAAAADVPSLCAAFAGMLLGVLPGGGLSSVATAVAGGILCGARLWTMRRLAAIGDGSSAPTAEAASSLPLWRRIFAHPAKIFYTKESQAKHFYTKERQAKIFRAKNFRTEHIRLRMAFAATASMIASAGGVAGSAFTVRTLAAVFLSAITTALSTLALGTLGERSLARSGWRAAGEMTILFAVTRALRDVQGMPFGLGTAFAFAAAVLCARPADGRRWDVYRILYGTAAGFVCGIAIDPAGMPVYAAAAMAAGILYRFGAAWAIFGGWAAVSLLSLGGGSLAHFASIAPEITVTAAILIPLCRFGVIPPVRTNATGEIRSRGEAEEQAIIAAGQAECGLSRLRTASAALESTAQMLSRVSEKVRRPPVRALRAMCDRAMHAHCHGCENESLCWEREYAATTDFLTRMTAELHRTGRVSAAVVPASLAGRCHAVSEILDEVGDECTQLAESARLHDRSDVLAGDFSAFAQMLGGMAQETEDDFAPDTAGGDAFCHALADADCQAGGVSVYGTRRRQIVARDLDLNRIPLGGEEIAALAGETLGGRFAEPEYRIDGDSVTMTMTALPRFRTTVGAFSRAASQPDAVGGSRENALNGDTSASFTTKDGRMYLIVCDGMGSGGEASLTSRMAIAFLEEMLGAGAELRAALTMLNHVLRCRGVESSAGLDLMELDLYTGEARFVKSGAAPSFVARQGRLFRLSSKTAPIGILRALDAEMIRFTPEAGDVIVMLSDGVSGTAEDVAWLCDLLSSRSAMEEEAEQIARRIVRAAAAGEEKRDDISAAVLRVESA